MRASQSEFVQGEELLLTARTIEPQPTPICATETRFCLPHNVRLHLDCPSSEEHFRFTDVNDRRIVYFSCNGHDYSGCFSLDQGKEKYLRDSVGAIFLYMKRKLCSCKPRYDIFTDATREKHICKLQGHTAFMKLKMSTEFSDVSNDGIQRQLWLTGDLFTECTIYLGKPKHGGVLLARMIPADQQVAFWSAVEFIVEIAANVDIALVAMLCIAVEQDCRDRRKAITKSRT